jgi:outer membrane protein OmpA-like peptidoglycan-associated protein
MKKTNFLVLCVLSLSAVAVSQQKDATGCKDHPLFTRMPGVWIHSCDLKEFNAHTFDVGSGKKVPVEGRYWLISYYPQANVKPVASDLQILRNFENAVQKLGGKVLDQVKGKETLYLVRDGKELWVDVQAEFTGKYVLTIVEKNAMAQDIVANADAFSNDLKATGHSAVYGIYFDTGKFDLKPESNRAIEEIAKLLKNDAVLKLYIVGHTDNTGTLESNMLLSQQRADAVVQALIRDHGILAARLKAFGNGPYSPVSTNDTEEGKAKNRRVEIVKQ